MTSHSSIGSGTVVRGSVRGEGDLSIHGRVEGDVAVSGELLIAETALLRSDVSALRVVVRGAVLGNISAEQSIVLEPGARVVGDLGAPQIGIRPGGLVRGKVSTNGPLSASEAETGRAGVSARTSPRAVSVAMAPSGRGAPSSASRAPAARPAAPLRAPARPITASAPAVPARAKAPVQSPPPAAMHRAAAPAANARPEPVVIPRGEAPHIQVTTSAALPSPGLGHADTAPSAMMPPASAEQDHDDEGASLSAGHEGGGPPPPVVPALRKGAKASLRRKGAR